MNQPIVTLTPNAINHLKKIIEEQQAAGFRLAVKERGCSGNAYLPDIVAAGKAEDINYQFEGISIYIDQSSVEFLNGTVIDFIDHGLGQTKLIYNNPNAASLCGCGESFNVAQKKDRDD